MTRRTSTPHLRRSGRLKALKARCNETSGAATDDRPHSPTALLRGEDEAEVQQTETQPLSGHILAPLSRPYTPHCHEPLYTFVSQWLQSVTPDQDRQRRSSDSRLYAADADLIPGQPKPRPTGSEPDLNCTQRETNAVSWAPTPAPSSVAASAINPEGGRTSTSLLYNTAAAGDGEPYEEEYPDDVAPMAVPCTTTRVGVAGPQYRWMNLKSNNIRMWHPDDQLPARIALLSKNVVYRNRSGGAGAGGPDGVLRKELQEDRDVRYVFAGGASELQVEDSLSRHVFPKTGRSDLLQRSVRVPMHRYTVPLTLGEPLVSNPVPDMLYGYNESAFSEVLTKLASLGAHAVANSQGNVYPFLVVELKGDDHGSSPMFVATNQCLGGAASCVNMIERLNDLHHRHHDGLEPAGGASRPVDDAVFSIATNGAEARLYVSWRDGEEGHYWLAMIDGFHFFALERHLQFYDCVRNIIDWGTGERLGKIRSCVDDLLRVKEEEDDEARRRASAAAKSREPPRSVDYRPAKKRET